MDSSSAMDVLFQLKVASGGWISQPQRFSSKSQDFTPELDSDVVVVSGFGLASGGSYGHPPPSSSVKISKSSIATNPTLFGPLVARNCI